MDNDSIDKDEFFTTLSKRMGENFQSTPSKSRRTETCSPANCSRNSNEGESYIVECVMICLSLVCPLFSGKIA